MNLKEQNVLENINWTKCINIEGLTDYILNNDLLFENVKTWVKMYKLGLYPDTQIAIEIKSIIHQHFKSDYVKDYKKDSFLDWIITDWIEHLLDANYLIKELKTYNCFDDD